MFSHELTLWGYLWIPERRWPAWVAAPSGPPPPVMSSATPASSRLGTLGTDSWPCVLAFFFCHLFIHSLNIDLTSAFPRQGAKQWRHTEQTVYALTDSPPKQILTQVLIKNESCRSTGAVESLWKALVSSAAPPFLFMQVSGGLPVYGTDLGHPLSHSHFTAPFSVKSPLQPAEPVPLTTRARVEFPCTLLSFLWLQPSCWVPLTTLRSLQEVNCLRTLPECGQEGRTEHPHGKARSSSTQTLESSYSFLMIK